MKKKKPLINKNGEIRELSAAEIRAMRPAEEVLPPEFFAILPKRKPGQRGPQKAPIKQSVTLRLDSEILSYFKATGTGWQSRINNFLKAAVLNLPVI